MGEEVELDEEEDWEDLEDEVCYFANVTPNFDNSSVVVECKDFSGLLRVISWVLNGLQVRVASADCHTEADGHANDTFEVTDFAGQPLDAGALDLVADTLQSFLQQCISSAATSEDADELVTDNLYINNTTHEQFTELAIYGADKPGFLLEIASVLTGVGVSIKTAQVKTCTQFPPPSNMPYECQPNGRMFRFLVDDGHGDKLTVEAAQSLMYVLNLFMGKGKMPTHAPGIDYKAYRG